MVQRPAFDKSPTAVGKYRVIAKLGEGGMAHVFLAVSHGPVGFSKLAVLKVVRPHLAQDPEILQMFLDEARLAGRLNHANVVQTYEVGEEGGQYVLVMEYLDGQPLRAIQKRMEQKATTIPLPLQLKILIDALSGLHYAHQLRDFDGTPLSLVHRDVSPHNIFVTYDGQVKVLDFGIAKAATSSQETKSGVIKGKFSYMAPEQFRNESVDPRADVYSMGAILWQAATGFRLWKGVNDAQVLYAVTHGQIPRPSDVKSAVPTELERICMRALALDANDRYETAAEMQKDLRSYASELSSAVSALELGAFVATEFARERRLLRQRIEHQLRRNSEPGGAIQPINLQNPLLMTGVANPRWSNSSGFGELEQSSEPTPTRPPPRDSDRTPSSFPGPSSTREVSTASGSAPGTPTSESTSTSGSADIQIFCDEDPDSARSHFLAVADSGEPKKTSNKRLVVGAVAAVLITSGVLGGFAVHLFASEALHARGDGSLMQPTASVSENTPEPEVTASEAAPVVGAADEFVEIEISASPTHATVFLDGKALSGNPTVEQLPKDDTIHEVRIEAPDYVTRIMGFKADRSARLGVELVRHRSPSGSTKSSGKPTSPASPASPKNSGFATDNINPWAQ